MTQTELNTKYLSKYYNFDNAIHSLICPNLFILPLEFPTPCFFVEKLKLNAVDVTTRSLTLKRI